MNLLIVTGLSGAGKSLAMNALEDIGFFCIDNIPANLLAKLMDFSAQSENPLQRVAIVLDIRGAHSAQDIKDALQQLSARAVEYKILFLDARSEVLERRYKETRRRHPISIASQVSTEQALLMEREILDPLFEAADYKIDTSLFSTAQLKDRVISLFVEKTSDAMTLTFVSFGFKYGQPKEADIVFDVRCLPNPFYVPELKDKTGLDTEVMDYVMQFEEAKGLLERMEELLRFSLPLYVKEGKSQLTVAIGCTGGKHRSITFAALLAKFAQTLGYNPGVEHRDVQRR
ncbi:MAG: RNase adapter RapZ [Ruthenibacterium sp.]